MSSRQFEITAAAKAEPAPARQTEAPESAVESGRSPRVVLGAGGNPVAQAAALAQASGGRLERAGGVLLQLQRGYGNRYVQRVVGHTYPGADSTPLVDDGIMRAESKKGLPDRLKVGVEALSGMDLSDVRVHTDSAETARLSALAYTRGNDIYLGPGQARYLAHEAWHVVQQRQGRVRPTRQAQGVSINDDMALEREADAMGTKALRMKGADRAGSIASPGQPQHNTSTANGVPVIQRLMTGQHLLQRTDPTDVPLQQIAALVNQYNATKGIFVRLTPQVANQRFGLLQQINRAIYAWFNTVSQNNERLDANPHTPVMKQLLVETDEEHVDLVHRTKNNANVTPFETAGMTALQVTNAQALWQSIVGGQGKIKFVGNSSYNKKMLSDLAKIMSTSVGRNLLTYLNTQSAAETTAGQQDPLTNIYIGQHINQLPANVTAALPAPIQDTGVSQSQPLINSQAFMQGGAPVPVGGAPANFRAVAHRRDFRQAVRTNQRGAVYGGQQYAFGQGTGAFVRVVEHNAAGGSVPGVAGADHEVIMPRFVTLAHELGHSANQRAGAGTAGPMGFEPLFALAGIPQEEAKNRWDDPEELLNILNIENAVRTQSGLETRTSHKSIDGLKKSLRWLNIKSQVVGQFGIDNQADSFAVGSVRSQGIWFTDSGWQFAQELVDARNDLHDNTEWNNLQPSLNQFLHMNVAQEKGDYLDNLYNDTMAMVADQGDRDTLPARIRPEYDTVQDRYTTQRVATLGDPTEYNRLIQRIYSIQVALGQRLNFPGNGMPMIRW